MSKINYQEVIDDAVAGCCDSFGATEGEDAVQFALADARESSHGWTDFLAKFLKSLEDRLNVVPKVSIDTAAILKLVGGWFDQLIGPMNFAWIPDVAETAIKAAMKNMLLAGVEFVISKVLGT